MKIEIDISAEHLANLFTTAIESGDPVTTARRGGWCDGIYWNSKAATPPRGDFWYADPNNFKRHFHLEIVEVDDEATGHKTSHTVNRQHIKNGLTIMAHKYAGYFAQIIRDDIDAPCADIFLQCVLFNEEKYA